MGGITNNMTNEEDYTSPQPCPLGQYCKEASTSPFGTGRCPAGFFCPKGTADPCDATGSEPTFSHAVAPLLTSRLGSADFLLLRATSRVVRGTPRPCHVWLVPGASITRSMARTTAFSALAASRVIAREQSSRFRVRLARSAGTTTPSLASSAQRAHGTRITPTQPRISACPAPRAACAASRA